MYSTVNALYNTVSTVDFPFSLISYDRTTFVLELIFAHVPYYEVWITNAGFGFTLTKNKIVVGHRISSSLGF